MHVLTLLGDMYTSMWSLGHSASDSIREYNIRQRVKKSLNVWHGNNVYCDALWMNMISSSNVNVYLEVIVFLLGEHKSLKIILDAALISVGNWKKYWQDLQRCPVS